MLETRGDVASQRCLDYHGHDIIESKLLTALSQIRPENLESMSHDECMSSLANTLRSSLDQDYTQLLVFTQAIKDCDQPSYKRNVLIGTLNRTLIQDQTVLLKLLSHVSVNNCDFVPWKEMANALVTLPDLVANCGLLSKFTSFVPESFYYLLLDKLYQALVDIGHGHMTSNLSEGTALFYAHIIGRIAINGFGRLVWNKFTSRFLLDKDIVSRNLGSTILCIPIRVAEFEIFVEPLLGPIFYYLKPTPINGKLIKSIIGKSLLHNETFHHIVCRKYILQTNFSHARHRQNLILFNIFSYLACMMNNNETAIGDSATVVVGEQDTSERQVSNVLIKTLLEVAKSWSNSTKILLRSNEHNRYIGCALVMALKFALQEQHKQRLLESIDEIQSEIIRGLQIYLNRSSNELRNTAMCVGEILLTKLHDLLDAELGKSLKEKVALELNIEWDESCMAIKRMFDSDIDTLCKDIGAHSDIDSHDDVNSTTLNANLNQKTASDKADNDGDSDADECDDSMDAPIYLNDCISGLVDNNKPRYVKLCLVKSKELIRQLSKQTSDASDVVKAVKVNDEALKKANTNDAIRDVAIELAQVLLYLEDQFNLDNFDALQKSALVSLCVAAPDLVAKYLLDELNNQTKNIRQQMLILQTLVESAQQLGNGFTKYGALYFYGIVHELKISTFPSSSSISIVSAVKSIKADQLVASDDSYLLSRVLLSVSLIIKCLNQQLITCKLSNDLLDILAAYRRHPDSGVRKAIVSCLTVIRDCTPTVYFREHLHDKTAHLFGAWLAIESEFIREDK